MDRIFYNFSVLYILGVRIMSEVYVFTARISKLGRGRSLGIYIPKSVAEKMGHLHGREVVVIVYTKME